MGLALSLLFILLPGAKERSRVSGCRLNHRKGSSCQRRRGQDQKSSRVSGFLKQRNGEAIRFAFDERLRREGLSVSVSSVPEKTKLLAMLQKQRSGER